MLHFYAIMCVHSSLYCLYSCYKVGRLFECDSFYYSLTSDGGKKRVQTTQQPLQLNAIWWMPLNLMFDLMSIANVDPLCLCIVGKSNYVAATEAKTQSKKLEFL